MDRRQGANSRNGNAAQIAACGRWCADIFVEKVVRSRYVGPWQRLLDLNAERGEGVVRFAELGYLVDGIGMAGQDIARAERDVMSRGLGQRCRLSSSRSTALAFADNTFDIVVGRGMLHAGERHRWAEQVNRVLKPGGVALFIVKVRHATAASGHDAALHAGPGAWSAADVRDLERSFQSVLVERFTILGRVDRALPGVAPVLRARLKQLDFQLLRACPAFAALTTGAVLVCRKRDAVGEDYRAAA